MKTEIFPFMLNRLSTVSYELIEILNKGNIILSDSIDHFINLNKQIEIKKTVLSRQLYEIIGLLQDIENADKVKSFRRDLYNGRIDHIPFCVVNFLTKNIRHNLEQYFKSMKALELSKAKYYDLYEKNVVTNRKKTQIITKSNKMLQKGLILASKPLFQEINKYSNVNVLAFRKNELNTELSFLKYISRICCKTSPFSTFTSLSTSKLINNAFEQNSPIQTCQRINSHIRLNNQIFRYITGLLTSYCDFRLHLYVELNPTINEEDNFYQYIINHNNIESIQKVSKNDLISAIISCYKRWKRPVTLLRLIQNIMKLTEENRNVAENFLFRLLDSGLLNFDFEVSGLDPNWSKLFIKKLIRFEKLNVVGISELIIALKKLNREGKKYEKASVFRRTQILDESFLVLKNICERIYRLAGLPQEGLSSFGVKIEQQSNPIEKLNVSYKTTPNAFKKVDALLFIFKPEQIYFEDTTTNISFSFPYPEIKKVASNLNKLYSHLAPLNLGKTHRDINKSLYNKRKAVYGENFSFLSFYFEFYKKYKSVSDVKPNHTKNQIRLSKMKWLKDISDAKNLLRTVDPTEEEHNLTNFFSLKKNPDDLKGSYSAFIQPFYDNGWKFVVNGTMTGYGKWMSRFLHLFSADITNSLRQMNVSGEADNLLLESTDASFFNANIHPALMPYESRMPGGNNYLPKTQQILVSDIMIEYNESENNIILRHKTLNKKIFVFDLCFQGINGRSNLYQLLNKFSQVKEYGLYYIISEINKILIRKNDNHIIVFPRLIINNLVIQRKYWIIQSMQIPLRQKQESHRDYFLRVNIWRKENEMPDEVFLTIAERRSNFKPGESGKDDYKPQYICFSNPLFILLFSKIMKRAREHIKIEEMLPGSKHLLKINNQRYVSEFLIQWYNK